MCDFSQEELNAATKDEPQQAAAPQPALTQAERPRCSTGGSLAGGMCGYIIVGGKFCGCSGACVNKVTQPAQMVAPMKGMRS